MLYSTKLNTLFSVSIGVALLSTLSLSDEIDNSYFIDTTIGVNNSVESQKNSIGDITRNSIDEDGYNIGIALGYKYTDNISFKTSYKRVTLDDIHKDNIYLGVQYSLEKINNFTPYLAIDLGYSKLNWDTQPINNVVKSDYKSGSYLIGMTAGISYELNNNLALITNYQLELMNHSTNLKIDSSTLELQHKISHDINMGIRYSF